MTMAKSMGFARDRLLVMDDRYDVLKDTDALVLVTEWKPLRQLDVDKARRLMRGRLIIDGRNRFDAEELKAAGFEYEGMGRR